MPCTFLDARQASWWTNGRCLVTGISMDSIDGVFYAVSICEGNAAYCRSACFFSLFQ